MKDLGFGTIFKIFRGITFCLGHFTLFYLILI